MKNSALLSLGSCAFFILLVTLFPYTFYSLQTINALKMHSSYAAKDASYIVFNVIGNILLYIPFGASLAAVVSRVFLSRKKVFLFTAVSAFIFSGVIEYSQRYLPMRFASLGDIVLNSLGACLGILIFFLYGGNIQKAVFRIYKRIKEGVSFKKAVMYVIFYIVFISLVTVFLYRYNTIRNWDTAYPLLIGNEATSDRPWQGTVYSLRIWDRALESHEIKRITAQESVVSARGLIAEYEFKGKGAMKDATGTLPDFISMGGNSSFKDTDGVSVAKGNWLISKTAARLFAKKINESSRFTLSVRIKPSALAQYGPARIVSYSKDPHNRNITLGQEKSNLAIRVRTPLTGRNGTSPELVVPCVFKKIKEYQVTAVYDGFSVVSYIDEERSPFSLRLSPGLWLFNLLGRTRASCSSGYRMAYYIIAIFPLGAFLLVRFGSFLDGAKK